MDSALNQNSSQNPSGCNPRRYESDRCEPDARAPAVSPRAPAVTRSQVGGQVISIAPQRHSRVDGRTSRGPSSLIQRNIIVGSHRTTMRLEPAMWDAIGEICQREGVNLNYLCTRIADRRSASSLTATIRDFVLSYFRAAATEDGHARTGHGLLYREQGS